MRQLTVMFFTVVLAGLVGCGGESEPKKVEGVIPQHQLQALDKAKNVENVLEEANKARGDASDN